VRSGTQSSLKAMRYSVMSPLVPARPLRPPSIHEQRQPDSQHRIRRIFWRARPLTRYLPAFTATYAHASYNAAVNCRLFVGVVVPDAANVASMTLDGRRTGARHVRTSRGDELVLNAHSSGKHTWRSRCVNPVPREKP
jgi:hypothetical protein